LGRPPNYIANPQLPQTLVALAGAQHPASLPTGCTKATCRSTRAGEQLALLHQTTTMTVLMVITLSLATSTQSSKQTFEQISRRNSRVLTRESHQSEFNHGWKSIKLRSTKVNCIIDFKPISAILRTNTF
jgi:hypothetical protein